MTSPKHFSGTDPVAEAARSVSDSIIVNVQGDEPEIEPQTIDALVERLESSGADMATAATPFAAGADPADPNLVKVVVVLDGKALYFSRSPIPFWRDRAGPRGRHIIYIRGFTPIGGEILLQLASWPPTPLELSEKLEQLRVLEHGRSIDVILTPRAVHGIDTPQQYEEFVRRFGKNQRGAAAQATRRNHEQRRPAF